MKQDSAVSAAAYIHQNASTNYQQLHPEAKPASPQVHVSYTATQAATIATPESQQARGSGLLHHVCHNYDDASTSLATKMVGHAGSYQRGISRRLANHWKWRLFGECFVTVANRGKRESQNVWSKQSVTSYLCVTISCIHFCRSHIFSFRTF